MNNGHNTESARKALFSIPPDLPREDWIKVGMAAHAIGLQFEDWDTWSAQGEKYKKESCQSAWKSFKPDKGIGPGTLYAFASDHGYSTSNGVQTNAHPIGQQVRAPAKLLHGMSVEEIWGRCEPVTNSQPYIVKKQALGVPLDNLRVVPKGDRLRILGESMVGALVVPVFKPDGALSSLQFITTHDVAERLKSHGTDKPNLPGHSLHGWFTVGEIKSDSVIYICEGIGTAWACWQATGKPSVVCFGSGRVSIVASELRKLHPQARLVMVPDVGKEKAALDIASAVAGKVATMPDGWEQNSDMSDYLAKNDTTKLEALLLAAVEPTKSKSRYKLLGAKDIRDLPPLSWCVRGVFPSEGLAAIYGRSGSGKSFLALNMAAAIANGENWFDCRTSQAPVVYVSLEGEAGLKQRVQAWEAHQGNSLPDSLKVMLQPFQITNTNDVRDLATVVPAGSVLFVDTLNRAASTSDENSSKEMGVILEAAKRLQMQIGGLVVLVHHTGKDESKGPRGHSSLFAALDAAVEVTQRGNFREWRLAKSKDGAESDSHPFRLEVETLGLDSYGDPVSSCSVRVDSTSMRVRQAKVPQGVNQHLVFKVIKENIYLGATGKPGVPAHIPCISVEDAVRLCSSALECEQSRKVTKAKEAIKGLISRGLLGQNEGWLWVVN